MERFFKFIFAWLIRHPFKSDEKQQQFMVTRNLIDHQAQAQAPLGDGVETKLNKSLKVVV